MKSKKRIFDSTSKKGKRVIVLLKTIFGSLAGAAILTDRPIIGLFVFLGRDVMTEIVSWYSPLSNAE